MMSNILAIMLRKKHIQKIGMSGFIKLAQGGSEQEQIVTAIPYIQHKLMIAHIEIIIRNGGRIH